MTSPTSALKKTTGVWDRFQKADADPHPRLIGLSVGEVGTGKTHFWLGAPGPIVVFSFDKGLEGVVEPFQAQKDIYVAEYDWSPVNTDDDSEQDEMQDLAKSIRDKFIADFTHSLQHARTVIIDKETDLWEMFRYAEFGRPNDSPLDYPKLNSRYRKYMNMPKGTDVNFGCIEGMRDEWGTKTVLKKTGQLKEQGHRTGKRIRWGFSELDGLVHITLFHTRSKTEEGAVSFGLEVGKARGPGGFDVQEQSYENLSFADFAQLVFPGTDEGDWQ